MGDCTSWVSYVLGKVVMCVGKHCCVLVGLGLGRDGHGHEGLGICIPALAADTLGWSPVPLLAEGLRRLGGFPVAWLLGSATYIEVCFCGLLGELLLPKLG